MFRRTFIALSIVFACDISAAHAQPLSAEIGKVLPGGQLTIALPEDSFPYSSVSASGQLIGTRPEIWELWSKATGVPIKLVPAPWSKIIQLIKSGQVDAGDQVVFQSRDQEMVELSKEPHTETSVHIFYNNELTSLKDLHSLQAFEIGTSEQGRCITWLPEHGATNLHIYPRAVQR